jgi:hypothetical protein
MNLKTTIIALGVSAILGTGAASAQPAPQGGAYDEAPGYGQQSQIPYHQHRHHHGVMALLRDEVSAGRLSKKEETVLVEKIKQMRAERREEREARYGGEGAPPTSQMQQPR